ncbi:hypothetical protein OG21DRAFT_1603249 [Imleria badia]|nr:hypothetical protein OG21DRAFT_1603249 [Imleria badia]
MNIIWDPRLGPLKTGLLVPRQALSPSGSHDQSIYCLCKEVKIGKLDRTVVGAVIRMDILDAVIRSERTVCDLSDRNKGARDHRCHQEQQRCEKWFQACLLTSNSLSEGKEMDEERRENKGQKCRTPGVPIRRRLLNHCRESLMVSSQRTQGIRCCRRATMYGRRMGGDRCDISARRVKRCAHDRLAKRTLAQDGLQPLSSDIGDFAGVILGGVAKDTGTKS